jgi:glycosyltransferase involved in cell wall biosynthesis
MNGLALVESPDHVCCRYRVRAFLPALEGAGGRLRIEALARSPARRVAQLVSSRRYDFVLLQRRLLPSWQWAILRRSARRLVFDFDDAVLYRDSYDPRGPSCPRRTRRFGLTVREADLVLAGNSFLAGLATTQGARAERVRVIPTCVDTALLSPEPDRPDRPGLTLVWIGSSSTLQGLEQQRPLLAELGRVLAGLSLRLICDRFARFDPLRVECVPWSAATEGKALANADVGISLVPDDLWSRGKCGLKILQYLACGLPVVANPVGVHSEMVREGVEGFLARTHGAWIEAVRSLRDDVGLRRRMAQAARTTAVSRYSVSAWEGPFVAAVLGRSDRTGGRPRRDAGQARLSRIERGARVGAAEMVPGTE